VFYFLNGVARQAEDAVSRAARIHDTIGRLERARILKRTSKARRDRVYCARTILDILEEPARLEP